MNIGTDDRIVHTVALSGQGVEVVFQEKRHSTPRGDRITTIVVNPQYYEGQCQELIEAVNVLIDDYLKDERNPPSSIR